MTPQLGLPSSRAIFALLFFSLILLAQPVWSAPPPICTSANINPGPNDPVAFVVAATSPGAVSVVDLATNSVVCSIAVGNNPSHLALSPDSSLLLVENDADATVSVINLADGSTAVTLDLSTLVTPGTSGVTGNLATAYDGTHSFAYVAVYPNPLPATPAPVLGRISLDVSPATLASIGSVTVNGSTPANGDVGVAFLPDGSKGYITFDGGNTDVYATATDTFSASIPVTGGSFTVSPLGDFGYAVQTAAAASSAGPNQITIATNAFAATGAASGQTVCSRSNTATTSPDGTVAYYSCPANNSLQFITASSNQVTNTVNITTVGLGPNGIAATSDGSALVVVNNDTTVSIFTSLTSATPTKTNFAGPGGALVGVGQRPVLPVIIPSTPQSVTTNKTIQFAATTAYARNPAGTISNTIWRVNGTVGGDSTHGTISTAGLYTAPTTPPTPATVTVTATLISSEFPLNSKLYPGQSGSASVSVTVLAPITVVVTPKPSSLDLTTATTLPFTATVQNDLANKGVTWTVNGVTPGTTTTGTVSPTSTASGASTTYTAPKMISPPASVQITATSVSDPTASDTSTLTLSSSITFGPVGFNPPSPLLIENPDTLSITPSGDPYTQGVTWSIDGCSAATPATTACGSIISTSGAFTPPTVVPYASSVNPQAPATITFRATSVTDPTKFAVTNPPITITSNVAITGFLVNGAAPPAQLLIETASYTLAPVITGDTGQGVIWTIVNCSAVNPATAKCGTIVASSGVYTPPAIVPYALPVTSTSTASITFQATSKADPLVSKTFTISIGSTVSITGYQVNGAAPPAQLLIETPTYTFTPIITGDTGQGVTWTTLSCSAANPANASCGSFTNASTGAFATSKIVPYAPPITPTSTASITFQAVSVADPKVVFQPAAIPISSTVSITGYTVNGAAPAPPLLIETPTYALAPVITGDTGQGVTWTVLSCSSANPANASCGSFTNATTGAFATPKIVPYAAPVLPVSTASITFQATSVADPKVIFQPAAIAIASTIQLTMAPANSIVALIEKGVDFTPNASNGNVTLTNDTNQGVTFAISGTCFAPPNFGSAPTIPCGSLAGNSYTAPSVVPLAASTPAASLGTAQRAVITVTATSIADPVHTASTTFSISSNISFTIPLGSDAATLKNTCNPNAYSPTDTNFLAEIAADPCGFLVKPLSPTLAVGFPASLVESNQQGFATVTGLTWVASAGAVQPGSGTQTVFNAPANAGNVTITGYAVADFTKKAILSIPVVASKVIPDNIVPQFTLIVPAGQASGSIAFDIMGPTSGSISSGCSSFVKLTGTGCSFTPNATAPASPTGTTVVTLTLAVTRTGSTYFRPPVMLGPPSSGRPSYFLAVGLLALLAFLFSSRNRMRISPANGSHLSRATALLLLLALVLTWAAACNQFSIPNAQIQPPIPPTSVASGSLTLAVAPTTSASTSTDSMVVPVSVQ